MGEQIEESLFVCFVFVFVFVFFIIINWTLLLFQITVFLKLYIILIIGAFMAMSAYALQSPSIDHHVNELWLFPIFSRLW